MPRKFTIIYDTYCGWCYGAAPVFDALLDTGAEVEVLHRHLFQGSNAPKMSEGKGDYILKADAQIAALTGQTFSQTYAKKVVMSGTEVLESGYTAQAAALVHDQGARREFEIRHKLEVLRYIDGVSAQDRDAVVSALVDLGIEPAEAEKIGTPELAERAQVLSRKADQLMQEMGSFGVPTVLSHDETGTEVVNHSAFYGNPSGVSALLS